MKKLIRCFAGMFVLLLLGACSNTVTKPAAEGEAAAAAQRRDNLSTETEQTAQNVIETQQTVTETQQTEQITAGGQQTSEQPLSEKPLPMEEFWKIEGEDDSDTLTFATGLKIRLPDHWGGKFVMDTELGPVHDPFDHTLSICEKENAQAGAGGVLFNLVFLKHEEAVTYTIFQVDTVLGVYEQGGEEYVLIQEMPREMNYVEGNEDMKKAYENLSKTVGEVLIKTEQMAGFTECGIEDLDWVEYE